MPTAQAPDLTNHQPRAAWSYAHLVPPALTTAARDRAFGEHCKVKRRGVVTPWGDTVQVHDLLVPLFTEACNAAAADPRTGFRPQRIDSYACRPIRGSESWSLHSWALAWDFFATPEGVPPPGGVWKPDVTITPEFARHFTDRGFRWGRWFTRQDWPHIEWPWAPPTTIASPRPAPPLALLEADMLFKDDNDRAAWQVVFAYTSLLGRAPESLQTLAWRMDQLRNEGYARVWDDIANSGEGREWAAKVSA